MKSNDKENLRNMSPDELGVKLRELEKKLFQLKFKKVSTPLENPLEIRSVRRRMAMIKTWLNEKKKGTEVKQ